MNKVEKDLIELKAQADELDRKVNDLCNETELLLKDISDLESDLCEILSNQLEYARKIGAI